VAQHDSNQFVGVWRRRTEVIRSCYEVEVVSFVGMEDYVGNTVYVSCKVKCAKFLNGRGWNGGGSVRLSKAQLDSVAKGWGYSGRGNWWRRIEVVMLELN